MNALSRLLEMVKSSSNYLILDTETTGLDYRAEIVEIAILDSQGQVILNSYVRPTRLPIPAEAVAVHGIDTEMVANAPSFAELWPQVDSATRGRELVIYNAEFDLKMIAQSLRAHQLGRYSLDTENIYCAMLAYARAWGVYDEYHGSYIWQRLSNACAQQGLDHQDAHSSLGDCQATLALVRRLATGQWATITQDV